MNLLNNEYKALNNDEDFSSEVEAAPEARSPFTPRVLKKNYEATLLNGQDVSIPTWKPELAIAELSKVGKFIGMQYLTGLVELDSQAINEAFYNTEGKEAAQDFILHCVTSATIDGVRVTRGNLDDVFEGNPMMILVVFAHVIRAQYSDLLAKVFEGTE